MAESPKQLVKLGSPRSIEANWSGHGIMTKRAGEDSGQISSFPSEWMSPLLSFDR